MFGSVIIDVAIGLVFVFVFVSLIASSVAEGIEGMLKTRAMDLEKGIREILSDPDGKGKTREIFDHPLIHALFVGDYDPKKIKQDVNLPWKVPQSHMRWLSRRNLPSYIPGTSFAGALLDIIARGALPQTEPNTGTPPDPAKAVTSAATTPPATGPDPAAKNLDLDAWREAVKKIGNEELERAVLSAFDYGKGEIEIVKANLAAWFDSSMDRVSGWYKRRVQLILFCIGLVVAVVLNIDAITTATRLMNDETLRDAIVAVATKTVTQAETDELPVDAAEAPADAAEPPADAAEPPADAAEPPADTVETPATTGEAPSLSIAEIKAQLEELGFPMGWKDWQPGPQFAACYDSNEAWTCQNEEPFIWVRILVGWLITAFAVMFGAPFWFDLLGKIVSLRASGKPPVEEAKK